MIDILSTLRAIATARSAEQVWSIHTKSMDQYGFDRIMFGYTRFRTQTGFGDRQDLMVLSNFPESYVQWFIDQGMFNHAPMLQWAAENTGSMSWNWIAENVGTLSKKSLEIIEFNQRNKVTCGYTISFPETMARHKAAIALTGRQGLSQSDVDMIWETSGPDIEILNQVVHLKLVSLPFEGRQRKLTPRQREVLEWVGDGKTTADIATILSVSTAAIEKHMRLARETLAVETTAQAVLKASVQNQIYRLDQKA